MRLYVGVSSDCHPPQLPDIGNPLSIFGFRGNLARRAPLPFDYGARIAGVGAVRSQSAHRCLDREAGCVRTGRLTELFEVLATVVNGAFGIQFKFTAHDPLTCSRRAHARRGNVAGRAGVGRVDQTGMCPRRRPTASIAMQTMAARHSTFLWWSASETPARVTNSRMAGTNGLIMWMG